MNPMIGAAAVSAAGGLLNSIGGLFQGKKNRKAAKYNADLAYRTAIETTDKQNAANLALMEKNNAYNRQLWELENEYNSPENQRKRLEAAGINPYGALGSISNGNAASAPQASEIRPDFSNYKAGADKVAAYVPEIGNLFTALADGFQKYQMMKAMKLDNDRKEVSNSYLGTFLDYRNTGLQWRYMRDMQDYALNGGDVTKEQQAFFRQMQMNKTKATVSSLNYMYKLRKEALKQQTYENKLYRMTEGNLIESLGMTGNALKFGIKELIGLFMPWNKIRATRSFFK